MERAEDLLDADLLPVYDLPRLDGEDAGCAGPLAGFETKEVVRLACEAAAPPAGLVDGHGYDETGRQPGGWAQPAGPLAPSGDEGLSVGAAHRARHIGSGRGRAR